MVKSINGRGEKTHDKKVLITMETSEKKKNVKPVWYKRGRGMFFIKDNKKVSAEAGGGHRERN